MEFKNQSLDGRVHSMVLLIRCRKNSSYHIEKITVPYVISEDGSRFFLEHNGCNNYGGSKDCELCRGATPIYLMNHPETDLRKPFLPVTGTEENW